jgi:gamma-glutamylcyclotransferase (GGCT)/AIG2-like uncharacterized protein YtfP
MLYLAYGANTHRAAMSFRCPEAEFVGTARLDGYALAFRGVADVRPAKGQTVRLALWDISATDLAALDRFEGYPRLYTRQQVTFTPLVLHRRTVLPTTAKAWIYRMTPGRALAPPPASYLETLRTGYADCGLPTGQLAVALADTPTHGRESGYLSRQWAI